MTTSTGRFVCLVVTALLAGDGRAAGTIIDDLPNPGDTAPVNIPTLESKKVDDPSIALRFSLLMEDGVSEIGPGTEGTFGDDRVRRHLMSADDVENWASPTFISSVVFSLIHVLCYETDFAVIEPGGEDMCGESTTRENGWEMESEEVIANTKQEDQSVTAISLSVSLEAYDRSETIESSLVDTGKQHKENYATLYALNWTEWRVSFPVLNVGSEYEKRAVEEEGALLNGAAIWDRAVDLMEVDAQIALDIGIAKGNFHFRLLEDEQGILKMSTVGSEDTVFTTAIQEFSDGGAPYTEPLDPAPFHPIRIAGILLFIATIAFTVTLMALARNRLRERELDEVCKTEGQGGLITEEGLSHMLEAGKGEALKLKEGGGRSPVAAIAMPAVHQQESG